MASINKAILIGNLGRDPEVRFTPGGQAVSNFSIATTDRWKNKQSGNFEERTEWHNIVAWGKLAELCKEYLSKGRQVYIEGRLQTRSWDDKEGKKRYTTEVVAQVVQFLGNRSDGASRAAATLGAAVPLGTFAPDSSSSPLSAGSWDSSGPASGEGQPSGEGPPSREGPPPFNEEDDIPF